MKKFKRIQFLALVVIMLFSSFSTTALAADTQETSNLSSDSTYDFEVTPDMIQEDGSFIMPFSINQTFYMNNEHRGGDRTYSGNKLRYVISITDSNGNAVNSIIAVRLHDYNSSSYLREDQFWADGSTSVIQNIPIVNGRTYYFKYLLAYGTSTTFRVHMEITAYN